MGTTVVGVGAMHAPTTSAPAVEPQRRRTVRCSCTRGAGAGTGAWVASGGGLLSEDYYRTLRVTPGASRGEVKKAFRHLALQYHPDVVRRHQESNGGVEFQKISVAYQVVMGNIREAKERLQYWRRRYGLTEQELDRYRYYLNDDWFDM